MDKVPLWPRLPRERLAEYRRGAARLQRRSGTLSVIEPSLALTLGRQILELLVYIIAGFSLAVLVIWAHWDASQQVPPSVQQDITERVKRSAAIEEDIQEPLE